MAAILDSVVLEPQEWLKIDLDQWCPEPPLSWHKTSPDPLLFLQNLHFLTEYMLWGCRSEEIPQSSIEDKAYTELP